MSNNSNTEEDNRRQGEESPGVSLLDTTKSPGNVFEESLNLEDCVKILLNCLRNLEEVKDIHKLALFNNKNQIKGKKQLVNLSESIKFMSNKFDEFEKEGQEQKKVVEELRGEVSSLSFFFDRQEQYYRRNCFLIHGITPQKSEKRRCSSS